MVYDYYQVMADDHRRVLDRVWVAGYKRAEAEEERRWITGSRYPLFKNHENLTDRRRSQL